MKKNIIYDFKLKIIIKLTKIGSFFCVLFLILLSVQGVFFKTYSQELSLEYFLQHYKYISSTELCNYMFYDVSFINNHSYIDGKFYYCYTYAINFKSSFYEKAILYLQYDDENYNFAKDDILSNTEHSTEHHFSSYGFEFYENLIFRKKHPISPFSRCFVMMSYNDVRKTLLFIGFTKAERKLVLDSNESFTIFLNEQYSKYYQFEN